nr:hypothetical protein [Tanacetum cinerariifolium]
MRNGLEVVQGAVMRLVQFCNGQAFLEMISGHGMSYVEKEERMICFFGGTKGQVSKINRSHSHVMLLIREMQ